MLFRSGNEKLLIWCFPIAAAANPNVDDNGGQGGRSTDPIHLFGRGHRIFRFRVPRPQNSQASGRIDLEGLHPLNP